jgi:O-antigen ligase
MRLRARSLSDVVLVTLFGLSLWVGRGIDLGPVDLQPVQIAMAVLVVGVAVRLGLPRYPHVQRLAPTATAALAGVVIALLAIVAAATLSAVDARDVGSVVRFQARYVLGLAAIGALVFVLRPRDVSIALERALLLGGAASVVIAAAGYFVDAVGALTIRYGDRAQGLLNHPNQLAMLLTTLTPIALARAVRSPRRFGAWSTVIVLVLGVALTGSKANLLLLAVVVPLCAFLFAQLRGDAQRRVITTIGLAIPLATIAGAAFFVIERASPRTLATLERLLSDPVSTSTVVSRADMWTSAIDEGLQRPWFGVGADNGRYYLPHDHAHNVAIEYFLTMGVAGVAALGALVAALAAIALFAAWLAVARPRLPYDVRLGLIAYPTASIVYLASNQSSDSFGGTTLPLLWATVALTIAHLDRLPSAAAETRRRSGPRSTSPPNSVGTAARPPG